jgi:hypothetical protein
MTRALIHDAKHRYPGPVLRPRHKLDDDVDVREHALPGCAVQDDVEGVDLVTGVIAWVNGTDKEGMERLSASW